MTTYQQCSSNNNCRNQHKKPLILLLQFRIVWTGIDCISTQKTSKATLPKWPSLVKTNWQKHLHPPSQNFSNDLKEYCSFYKKKNVKWFLKLRPVIFLKIHISTSVQVSDIKFNFWLKTVVLPSWKFLKWWPDFQAQGKYISTPYEVDTPTTTSQ